jgi:DNA-binding response OmpR family regulator
MIERTYNILIIEDEAIVALELKRFIIALGYHVVGSVDCAEDAIELIEKESVDIVISDIKIRGEKDGTEISKILYTKYGVAVIFLTAFYSDELIEKANSSNPVGYIVKPFRQKDLEANIKLAINRISDDDDYMVYLIESFKFDTKNSHLYLNKDLVNLNKRETQLLEVLSQKCGDFVDYDYIIENIWGKSNIRKHGKKNIMNRLRKQTGSLREKTTSGLVQTITNSGLKLVNRFE